MSRSRAGRARRDPPTAPAGVRPTRRLALLLLIVAVGVVTFANSLEGPFIWDDDSAIVSNKTIRQLWPLSGPLSPPLETPVAGRPLVNLSFAINYAIGGVNVTSYHAVNIALHVGCALLLFAIIRRTLAGPRMPAAVGGAADAVACAAALLWMVHPLESEVANYVTQRSESLMALFFLLTLYAAIGAAPSAAARKGAESAGRDHVWNTVAVAACACGMASKQTMAVAPLVVVLYDRTFLFDALRPAWQKRRTLYAGLAATWLVLLLFLWIAPRSTVGASTDISAWTYVLNQAALIGRYLWLSIWPRALVLDYGLPRQLTLVAVAPMMLFLTALCAATVVAIGRWPKVGFAAAAFFLTLAPTSSVIPIVSEVGAERRMYLPMTALVTLAVVGAWLLLERWRARRLAVGLAAILVAALAARTMARNAEFAVPLTLWQTSVDRFPHGRSRMALATELATAGRNDEAIAHLRAAVPEFPNARAALGTELVVTGQIAEGTALLREFIAADPEKVNRIPAHMLLAQVFADKGDLDGAIADWRALRRLAPDDLNSRAPLAQLLTRRGETQLRRNDPAGAEPFAREAVQLAPDNGAALNLLGAVLASSGRFEEAVAQFREAVRVAPGDQQARANLERALQITSTSLPRPRNDGSGPR